MQKRNNLLVCSPFFIMVTGTCAAILFKDLINKWIFIPIIILEWSIMIFFILKYGKKESIRKWLSKPKTNFIWPIFSISLGLVSIPVFVMFSHLLLDWRIWLPWIIIALINPWLEEFYWRGLLLDYTQHWKSWISVLYAALTFSLYHAIFGIGSELFRGPEVITSTLVMGIVWGITYKKTNSLWWCILAHFFVDFFMLSAPAFLDLINRGWN